MQLNLNATAKIKGLKKKEKNKLKESEEKKEEKGGKGLEITTVKKTDKDLKLQELSDLKSYFEALLPKEVKEQEEQELKLNTNSDLSKDIKAGKLKKMEKNEDIIGVEDWVKKKKGKKPKEPKEARKNNKKVGLVLDFEMIQKISDAGLSAPTKVEDIPMFLKNLSKNQNLWKNWNRNIKLKKKQEMNH